MPWRFFHRKRQGSWVKGGKSQIEQIFSALHQKSRHLCEGCRLNRLWLCGRVCRRATDLDLRPIDRALYTFGQFVKRVTGTSGCNGFCNCDDCYHAASLRAHFLVQTFRHAWGSGIRRDSGNHRCRLVLADRCQREAIKDDGHFGGVETIADGVIASQRVPGRSSTNGSSSESVTDPVLPRWGPLMAAPPSNLYYRITSASDCSIALLGLCMGMSRDEFWFAISIGWSLLLLGALIYMIFV